MANPKIADYWQGYRDSRIAVLMAGLAEVKRILTTTDNVQYNEGFKKGLERVDVDLSKLITQDAEIKGRG